MVNGLYTAGRAMMNGTSKQDIVSNALANINTPGFKMSHMAHITEVGTGFEKRENTWRQRESQRMDELFTDWRQGPMLATGNSLDLAIQGEGFFAVRTPTGESYTRTLSLRINVEGTLVDMSGSPVMSKDGEPIKVTDRGHVEIAPDGRVMSNGQENGQINIVDFPKPYELRHDGYGHYEPYPVKGKVPNVPIEPPPGVSIASGFLEGSNANSVEAMALMVTSFRNYEADSKVIHAIESTLDKAINQVARV
jgi:flagellar basal-body rod protein FlgG